MQEEVTAGPGGGGAGALELGLLFKLSQLRQGVLALASYQRKTALAGKV